MSWLSKLRVHVITLSRPFAIPFFGGCALIGSLLAGGTLSQLNTWLGFIAVALLMASCHSQNTYIDWAVGLDRPVEGSVEKGYTGGCGVITGGHLNPRDVIANFTIWAALGLGVCGLLAVRVGPYIFIPAALGLGVPYFYTRGKFSWYHELALAIGVALAGVMGMFAVTAHPAWWQGLIVALPTAIILSFLGLAFDEYLDAYANLKKGVSSLAYKVWEYRFDLSLYMLAWLVIVFILQMFLIEIGLLKPLTMISLVVFPFIIAALVFLKPWADKARDDPTNEVAKAGFNRVGRIVVTIGMTYPVLVLIGQALGK